ncbi:hypothetical protein ACQ4PT_027336 [Festuca glaucescens]
MTLVSPHLKRLELYDIEFEGCSLDFSSCESIFRNNLKWGPMFSKLKTLLLSEWCVADDFAGLVYFLQHSPILESLTLQLDFGTHKKHLNRTDKSYNLREQSLLSKHLKIVKIICVTKEDARVRHVLEILRTHGVPSEQIDIQ